MTHKPSHIVALRGLACLTVILWHLSYPELFVPQFPFNNGWISVASGMAAVWIFFFLSGYSIGKTFVSGKYTFHFRSIAAFIFARLSTIAPLYYFVVVINIVAFRLWNYFGTSSYIVLLKLTTFTASDLVTKFGVGYLWTISAHMQFYLLAPILIMMLMGIARRIRPMLMIISIVVLGFTIRYTILSVSPPPSIHAYLSTYYPSILLHFDLFITGILLSMWMSRRTKSYPPAIAHVRQVCAWILIFCLLALAGFTDIYVQHSLKPYLQAFVIFMPTLVALVTAVFIYFTVSPSANQPTRESRAQPFIRSLSPLSIMTNIGILSYELYLFHYPIIHILGVDCNKVILAHGSCMLPALIPRFILVVSLSITCTLMVRRLIEKVHMAKIIRTRT